MMNIATLPSQVSGRFHALLRTTAVLAATIALAFSARADSDDHHCKPPTHKGPQPITILFVVDTTGYTVTPQGMHIAGQFATDASTTITTDWNPGDAGSSMHRLFGDIYTIAVTFPASSAGESLQFEFVRNDIWFDTTQDYSEGNPGTNTLTDCGVPDGTGGYNRIITIPSEDALFFANFDECGELVR
jgi:hypothetical protein